MRALLEDMKSGQVAAYDVPAPELQQGGILVRTAFSAISSGTEKAAVEAGRKSLLGKAMARPDLVKQVLEYAQSNGIAAARQKVQARLETFPHLGYSCSGFVLEAGAGVTGFQPGDRVACAGGGYASHCEINFVPANLAVRIPANVSLEAASLTTIGAIAVQGVRQANVTFGETVAVIGVGLVGVLAIQVLRAAGCRVIAIDLSSDRAAQAMSFGAHLGLSDQRSRTGRCGRFLLTLRSGCGADHRRYAIRRPAGVGGKALDETAAAFPLSGMSAWACLARTCTEKRFPWPCLAPTAQAAMIRFMRRGARIIPLALSAGRRSEIWRLFWISCPLVRFRLSRCLRISFRSKRGKGVRRGGGRRLYRNHRLPRAWRCAAFREAVLAGACRATTIERQVARGMHRRWRICARGHLSPSSLHCRAAAGIGCEQHGRCCRFGSHWLWFRNRRIAHPNCSTTPTWTRSSSLPGTIAMPTM